MRSCDLEVWSLFVPVLYIGGNKSWYRVGCFFLGLVVAYVVTNITEKSTRLKIGNTNYLV